MSAGSAYQIAAFVSLSLLVLGPVALRAQSYALETSAEEQLVALINQARQREGLAPLAVDLRLTSAARRHSELMAQRAELAHQLPRERPLEQRFAAEKLPSDREGENLALNENAASAHEGLMHSPPHRRNILDPDYNAVGVGVVRRGYQIYVTEDFARRLPILSETQAEAAVQNAVNAYMSSHGLPPPGRRPQPQLRRLACEMAHQDAVDGRAALGLPAARTVFTWTAGNPAVLPKAMDQILSPGITGGYSLGACFAPSVTHPGGLYWLVMVSY